MSPVIGQRRQPTPTNTSHRSRIMSAHEIADAWSLKKRRGELEDTELELLVEREPLDELMAAATARRTQLDLDVERLRAAIDMAAIEIDAEANVHVSARAALVDRVPGDLLANYDRIRKSNNGIGIARLEHGTCMACRLKLSAVDIDRIRHQGPDHAAHCEQCGAILVP